MSDAPNLRTPVWALIPLVVLVWFTFIFLKIGGKVLTGLRSYGLGARTREKDQGRAVDQPYVTW